MTTHDSQPTTDPQVDEASAVEPVSETGDETRDETRDESSVANPRRSGAPGDQVIPPDAVMDFNARWEAIQRGFVDDPRSAVSDADSLVSDVLDKLSTTFDEQHGQLEAGWSDGEPDTEELRSAFQRYRDFFDRLLTI